MDYSEQTENTLDSETFSINSNELLHEFKPHASNKKAVVKGDIRESKFSEDKAWWVSDPDHRLVGSVLSITETYEEEFGFCPKSSWIQKSAELQSDLETKKSWTTRDIVSDPTGYFMNKHGESAPPNMKAGFDYRLSRGANFKELSQEEKQRYLDYMELLATSYPTYYYKQRTEVKFVKGDSVGERPWFYNHDLIEDDYDSTENPGSVLCDELSTAVDPIVLVKFEK